MAAVHGAGMLLILALLALHIAGAFYHHFVLKTDVLRRMLRSGKRRRLIILFYFPILGNSRICWKRQERRHDES